MAQRHSHGGSTDAHSLSASYDSKKFLRSSTKDIFKGMVTKMARGSISNLSSTEQPAPARAAPKLIDQYLMFEHILEEKKMTKVQIADQVWFRVAVTFTTVANVIVLALQADFDCWKGWWDFKCESRVQGSELLDVVITVAFLAELLIRLYCFDWAQLSAQMSSFGIRHASQLLLPTLDIIVVLLRAADVFVLSSMGVTSGLKLISAFRVVHAVSVIKSLRLVKFFRELWLIVSGVVDMLTSLFYISLILTIVLWCFAILFSLAVQRDGPDGFDYSNAAWNMEDYWGSVSKACFTLFQVVTGDKWASSIIRPLIQQRPGLLFIFVPFICLTVLGLLNAIIGIVVENVLNSARANDESEGQEKRMIDARVMESLRTIFLEADTDGSKTLEYEELVAAVQKPRVRERMQVIGLPIKDLDLLFAMLDEDRTGSIEIDVFFRGCARMRGPAMAADLHQMSIDLDRNVHTAENLIQETESINDLLERLINQLDVVEVDVVRADSDDRDPVLLARRERMRRAALEEQAREATGALKSPGGNRCRSPQGRRGSVGSLVSATLKAESVRRGNRGVWGETGSYT